MPRQLCFLFCCVFWTHAVQAAPCDRLSADQKKLSQKIFRTTYPYDCCDETLDRCLKQRRVCKLAKRLRDDVCRRIRKKQDEKKIRKALDDRARSMTPMGKKATFDLTLGETAGVSTAPVQVVVYACARCPFCSKVVPELFRMATEGPLKGKIRLYFRPFPIRSHAGSVDGGLAMVAAAEMKKLWPFVRKLYGAYDHFSKENLAKWAGAVGIDRAAFEKKRSAKSTRKRLVQSKKEGIRNRVDATPTLFLNGRKYYGDMDLDMLFDIFDEAYDAQKGRQYCGK